LAAVADVLTLSQGFLRTSMEMHAEISSSVHLTDALFPLVLPSRREIALEVNP
jgi:hypothetical protein